MKMTIKKLILICGLLAVLPFTSCSDNEPDTTVTVNLVNAKLTYNGDGEWADALNTSVTGIDCQGVTFSHSATASEYGTYWSGFCASRVSDVDDYSSDGSWLQHQYASMQGGGVSGLGTPYIVGYWNSMEGENPESPSLKIAMTDGASFTVKSVYVNNTTYAYYTMLNGSAYSKKFTDGDWTKVSFFGVTANGSIAGPVDFYLADYRDGRHSLVKDWTMVDLSALSASGELKYVYLQMSSSDSGQWGMNTPAYVALDRLTLNPVK